MGIVGFGETAALGATHRYGSRGRVGRLVVCAALHPAVTPAKAGAAMSGGATGEPRTVVPPRLDNQTAPACAGVTDRAVAQATLASPAIGTTRVRRPLAVATRYSPPRIIGNVSTWPMWIVVAKNVPLNCESGSRKNSTVKRARP